MTERLEAELARHLAPAAAPEELWTRIEQHARRRNGASIRWTPWAVAAALALAAGLSALGYFAALRNPGAELDRIAVREYRRAAANPGRLEFRTQSASALRAWIKTETDIDVAIPEPARVELLGARLLRRRGVAIAAVAYRLNRSFAMLLVARGSGGQRNAQHRFTQIASVEGLDLYSWRMQGHVFTLVAQTPENTRTACLLCHAEAPRSAIAVN